jgi:hypothetical protein
VKKVKVSLAAFAEKNGFFSFKLKVEIPSVLSSH